ncbi:MAG: LytTR family transcriptional regulator DNA-binding domain-containing protein [Bacteroidota bacterium]
MQQIARIRAFLNQPYPDRDDLPSLIKGSVSGGAIVFFVLWAFLPFGLSYVDQAWRFCLLFGLISAGVALLLELIMVYVLKIRRDQPSWTMGKWLIFTLVLISLIALANYLCISWLNGGNYSWRLFIQALSATFLVAIFPVTIFGASNMIRHLRANQRLASDLPPQQESSIKSKTVEIPVLNSQRTFSIDANELLFVEAMQNYVTIYYQQEGQQEKEILRQTIGRLEELLADGVIVRCHRSFLVNRSMIEQIEGNAQGLQLSLRGVAARKVPVSRKYIKVFR